MRYIKKYDEYSANEGLVSALKAKTQIAKVQGAVFDKAYELIEKNPGKYKEGKQLLSEIEQDAKELYKKTVTAEDALTADEWWEEFSENAEKAVMCYVK